MTAADKLRQQLKDNCPLSKDDFIDAVINGIKNYGRAAFVCDSHIKETKASGTIRMEDESTLVEYARSEGFKDSIRYNKWGVREIVFTL